VGILTKYKFELSPSLARLVDDEKAESIKQDLGFARRFLNLLIHRIDKEIEDKIKESEAEFNYTNPNWELKQAELFGYRRAMRKVREILGPIEDKHEQQLS